MLNLQRIKYILIAGAILSSATYGAIVFYRFVFFKARDVPLWLWIYVAMIMAILIGIKDDRKKLILILSISGSVLLSHYIFQWPEFYHF